MKRESWWWGGLLVVLLAGCAGNKQFRQADVLVERGRYAEALELYRRMQGSEPDDRRLQARIQEVKRLEGQRLIGMADRLGPRDAARKFELYADATRYDPENTAAREGLSQARDLWLEQAAAYEREGQFANAIAVHERVLREFRDHRPSFEALARINDAQASRSRQDAARYLDRGYPGSALVELLRAQRAKPEDGAIDQEILRTMGLLRAKADLSSDLFILAPMQPAGGKRVVKKGPQPVPLLAVSLLTPLNERLQQAGLPLALRPGRSNGFYQLELNGSFSPVQRTSEKIEDRRQVSAGVTSRPNPEYQARKVQVDEAQARMKALETPVFEAQTRLEALVRERLRTGVGTATPEEEAQRKRLAEVMKPYKAAQEEFQKQSAQLARLPAAFEDPASREVGYPVERITLTARLTGEVAIRTAAQEVLKRVPLNQSITQSDKTHPLIKAQGDRPEIPADPLELPDEKTLRTRLEEKAVGLLAGELEALFRAEVARRWSEARRLAVAGKVEEAIDGFLIACLTDPGQSSEEAVRYILEARRASGLPLQEILQTPPPAPQAAVRE